MASKACGLRLTGTLSKEWNHSTTQIKESRLGPLRPGLARKGTTIELRKLRKRWSDSMLATFVGEVQSFEAPDLLVDAIPETVVASPLLFKEPLVRDSTGDDPGFRVSALW